MRVKAKGFGPPPFYLPPSPFDLYYGFASVKGKGYKVGGIGEEGKVEYSADGNGKKFGAFTFRFSPLTSITPLRR